EPDAVVILPFTVDDTVVIIKEWRQAVKRYNYGLPAGSIEADESLKEGAQRELREETGYEANSINHLVSIEPSNGLLNTVHHHFVAHDCEQIADQRLDNDESIAVDTTNLATLQEKILTNEIKDGRTFLNVLYYQFAQTQYEYPDASIHGNS
ncbi:MAG: NUDIX hydrolase, partial [Halobacteriaceae archaeon]